MVDFLLTTRKKTRSKKNRFLKDWIETLSNFEFLGLFLEIFERNIKQKSIFRSSTFMLNIKERPKISVERPKNSIFKKAYNSVYVVKFLELLRNQSHQEYHRPKNSSDSLTKFSYPKVAFLFQSCNEVITAQT